MSPSTHSPKPAAPALSALPGVGPKTAERLAAHGISHLEDLLRMMPKRYLDGRSLTPIREVVPGTWSVVRGTVVDVKLTGRPWRRALEIILEEDGARISAKWFSNRRPKETAYKKGDILLIAGRVDAVRNGRHIAFPRIGTEDESRAFFGRIIPVYDDIPNVSGRIVEKAIAAAVTAHDPLTDPLPSDIRTRRDLSPLGEALRQVHAPPDDISSETLNKWSNGNSPAHRRLAYDALFFNQLALAGRRYRAKSAPSARAPSVPDLARRIADLFGVVPTGAQQRVISEIGRDLSTPAPMQRLLEGDVGSGKTLVALSAIFQVASAGYQAAFMAPTEILADQHRRTLAPALERLGFGTVFLSGSCSEAKRVDIQTALDAGKATVAIGTHALFQESVSFRRLGLVVIDEQHRFGVSERLALRSKQGVEIPHLLVMTATPIPRTLALAVYGDLDLSVIDERPPGRRPVQTVVKQKKHKTQVYKAIEGALERGEQVYYICPLVEAGTPDGTADAVSTYDALRRRFGAQSVGLLHGRLTAVEKDAAMADFREGRTRLLVATTIVEVGMDVENATVMVIEDADRFGLSTLHQLRGRIGRSALESTCYLVAEAKTEEARKRLSVLEETTDGLEISEADLAIRGPGELYGLRQSGSRALFTAIMENPAALEWAREDATTLVERDPNLEAPENSRLKDALERWITNRAIPVGEEAG